MSEQRVLVGRWPRDRYSSARSPLLRYGVSLILLVVALLANLILTSWFGQGSPFVIYFLAVIVSAWYGGVGPGLLTTSLAGLLAHILVLSQRPPLEGQLIRLLIFLVGGMAVTLLAASLHASKRQRDRTWMDAENYRSRLQLSEIF